MVEVKSFKEGLEDVVAADSAICYIDGTRGILSYRGIDIHDLAENSSFEEVCYLLWEGRLPRRVTRGAWEPASLVTPLIRPPGEALTRALTTLDDGEEWLLEPHQVGDDACQWSPGIKLGVAPGSWFHRTECFGPVLGLMRAESLERSI